QHRHQLGEMRARELALERAVCAGKPAPHRLTDFEGAAKAHRGELVERLGVVFCWGERKRAAGRFGGGRILEQPRVMALHLAQMFEQNGGESVAAFKSEETGEAF